MPESGAGARAVSRHRVTDLSLGASTWNRWPGLHARPVLSLLSPFQPSALNSRFVMVLWSRASAGHGALCAGDGPSLAEMEARGNEHRRFQAPGRTA